MESEVVGARGKVLINELVETSVGSLLLLELLLELLWEQWENLTQRLEQKKNMQK